MWSTSSNLVSPTSRSIKYLKEQGYFVEVVEHYNSFTRRRNDLFGFIDLLALKAGEKPLAIQTTTGGNLAARRNKILEHENLGLVEDAFEIRLHGWRKLKVPTKKGTTVERWFIRDEPLHKEDDE